MSGTYIAIYVKDMYKQHHTITDPVNAKLCEGLLVIRTSNILKITGPKPLLLVRRIFCIFVIFLNKNDVQKDNLCLLG